MVGLVSARGDSAFLDPLRSLQLSLAASVFKVGFGLHLFRHLTGLIILATFFGLGFRNIFGGFGIGWEMDGKTGLLLLELAAHTGA
jgi:hypothetical protein